MRKTRLFLTTVLSFVLAATCGQCALLNCSEFLPPAHQRNSTYWPPVSHASRGPYNIEDNDVVARRFYEPRLHACFQAHPYDTSQLPLDVDALFNSFDVRYRFSLDRLHADSVGSDVVVTGSIYFWWRDAHRAWNVSDMPLGSIYVPATEIWTPALRVLHPLNSDIELSIDPSTTARVSHDGSIRVAYRRDFTAHCTRNLVEFPSDPQSCSLWFVLRNHPSADIRIANTSALYNASDPSIKSDSFMVLSIWDSPQEFEVPEEGLLPGFVLYIDMRRYPDFYIYNIIIPVIMLTAINIFTMFPEPSDRLNVAAMVIIGYPVLQNLVADTIPHSDEPSPIARYIAGSFMLAALNLLFCALLCFYEDQPEAALSRLFSAWFCYPVHCGLIHRTRMLEKIEEERRSLLVDSTDAARRRRARRRLLSRRLPAGYGATGGEGGVARALTAPTILVGGINNDASGAGAGFGTERSSSSRDSVQSDVVDAGGDGSAVERSQSALSVRGTANTPDPTRNAVDGRSSEMGQRVEAEDTIGDMPTEADLANRRHRYSFFALKFILGMVHFGLSVWLIIMYKVWPLLMSAMYEVPVFGWSLLMFAVVTTYLYVFENTIWPWFVDLKFHGFSCGCRRNRSSVSIVVEDPSAQPLLK